MATMLKADGRKKSETFRAAIHEGDKMEEEEQEFLLCRHATIATPSMPCLSHAMPCHSISPYVMPMSMPRHGMPHAPCRPATPCHAAICLVSLPMSCLSFSLFPVPGRERDKRHEANEARSRHAQREVIVAQQEEKMHV